MRRHLLYLKYVLRHKWFVFVEALRLGVPIWIAIFHDWDKFLPDEWLAYANYFYGNEPTEAEARTAHLVGIYPRTREDNEIAFARAWMLHQHRNKHHWQWWLEVMMPDQNCAIPIQKYKCLVWDRGQAQTIAVRKFKDELFDIPPYHTLYPNPMPDVYRREMLADWRGAGRALGNPDTRAWYLANKASIILHAETRAWIEAQLEIAE